MFTNKYEWKNVANITGFAHKKHRTVWHQKWHIFYMSGAEWSMSSGVDKLPVLQGAMWKIDVGDTVFSAFYFINETSKKLPKHKTKPKSGGNILSRQ